MLLKICSICFGISTCIRIAKDYGARSYIERKKGKKIIADPRSISEVAFDFVKDYFYLLVPGINIYKTFNIIKTKENDYADKIFNTLTERERLVDKELKNDNNKNEEKPKESMEKALEEQNKKMENQKEQKDSKEKPNYDYSLLELKNYYYSLDSKLRVKLNELINNNASVESKNLVISEINKVDEAYYEVLNLIKKNNEIKNMKLTLK